MIIVSAKIPIRAASVSDRNRSLTVAALSGRKDDQARMMNFDFHPEALQEYNEAARYYSEISQMLAIAFVTQIENGIYQIILNPQAWIEIEADIRRYLINRFPFGIYYGTTDT